MNAPNSSSVDRDLESLRRAQRAHEPSMEEILASIRSIIADDREPPAASAAPQRQGAPTGPQIVYANDSVPAARAPAPVLEPAPIVASAPARSVAPAPAPVAAPVAAPPVAAAPALPPVAAAPAPPPIVAAPQPSAEVVAAVPTVVAENRMPPAPPPAPEAVETSAAPLDEAPFVSPATDAAVSASFNALSATVALQSSAMVESLTREMLRPMLKSWLDDNLPSLVERLVRAEIQRVARGGR
jgi:cell pole-organizing protein PopZ